MLNIRELTLEDKARKLAVRYHLSFDVAMRTAEQYLSKTTFFSYRQMESYLEAVEENSKHSQMAAQLLINRS